MKNRKEIFFVVLLWGVVAYSIVLLTFNTLRFVFDGDAEFISAFAACLGAMGTFFAACVAAYLFTDWKDQARYESNKESSMRLLEHLSALRYDLTVKSDSLRALIDLDKFVVIRDEFSTYEAKENEKLQEHFFKNRHHAISLNNSKSKNINDLFVLYSEISKHFMHIATPHSLIMYDYGRYYMQVMNTIDIKLLNYNYNIINRSYNYFKIEMNVFLITKIITALNREVGYYDFNRDNTIAKNTKYPNLIDMIDSALDKIDVLEAELIRISNLNGK